MQLFNCWMQQGHRHHVPDSRSKAPLFTASWLPFKIPTEIGREQMRLSDVLGLGANVNRQRTGVCLFCEYCTTGAMGIGDKAPFL
mmetsp:Transcript_3512/g.9698  ORF Transcript_3512/g.9698 Transcript_3512/m.9698 type:complete len:85 (-) Transcript_3512:41-295(-)